MNYEVSLVFVFLVMNCCQSRLFLKQTQVISVARGGGVAGGSVVAHLVR